MRHVLESFIRRRFFVVHLALLTVAALLSARTVTVVAGHVVAEKVKQKAGGDKSVTHMPAPKPSASRDFDQLSEINIFLGKREVVQQQAAAVDNGPPPDANDCDSAQKSGLRLRLVGTVVFSDPESSLASIVAEDNRAASAEMYSINDCVDTPPPDENDPDAKLAAKPAPCNRVGDSAVLKRIEPERVCIWNESEHHMEYVDLADPNAQGPTPIVNRYTPPTPPPATDINIKKTGDNSYEVAQDEVNKALNNLAELSTQARIVPAFEGGKTVGFKLFSIRPGSLYSKIGLQNGDVITRINGYEMTDPTKALEIYTKLKDSKSVTVDMKRRGRPMTLDYNIVQ